MLIQFGEEDLSIMFAIMNNRLKVYFKANIK